MPLTVKRELSSKSYSKFSEEGGYNLTRAWTAIPLAAVS